MIITLTCVNININNIIVVTSCKYVILYACMCVHMYVCVLAGCERLCMCVVYMCVCVSMDVPRSDKTPNTQRRGLPLLCPPFVPFSCLHFSFRADTIVIS